MGLDIFFLGRDRVTDAVVSVPETREVGYFRKVNPLIAWFETHCVRCTGNSGHYHLFFF